MAAENADEGNEGGGGDGLEPAAHAVPPAEQQVGAGCKTGHCRRQRGPQRAAEDEREAERARRPGGQLDPILREGDALGLNKAALRLVDGDAARRDLAGELVHRSHPAQMGRAGGHIAHLTDLRRARAGEDAIGQYIDVKLPQVEAAGHDLHGLLDAEDLRTVFQQRLPGRHDKIHDALALLLVGIQFPAVHSFAPCCAYKAKYLFIK